MDATLISIGNELLNGSVINTNAAFISKALYEIGIKTIKTVVIPDEFSAISNAVNESKNIIIITGGLGPTSDDITKKCLADIVQMPLVFHEPTFKNIQRLFGRRGIEVTELNRQQAYVIKGCKVLINALGTAPGMYVEYKDKHIFALPGVPFEMKKMTEDVLIPILKEKKIGRIFHHRIIHTTGVPESYIQEMLSDWELTLPAHVKIAYLPEPGDVKIRLSLEGDDLSVLKKQANSLIHQLEKIIGLNVWGFDNDTLVGVIGKNLKENHLRLAVAESCTGGYLSHLITSMPGSSDFYCGGVISYSNEIKIDSLEVKRSTIEKYGAVSSQTVAEMAKGILKKTNSDFSIAISGIAGPDGGTPEKPVGLVWIAVSDKNNTLTQSFVFGNDRIVNIKRAAFAGLNMLRLKFLIKML